MKQRKAVLLVALIAVAFAYGSAAAFSVEKGDNYRITSGDLLMIRIPVEPLLSGEYAVGEDGRFHLPLLEGLDLGVFEIEGLTMSETTEVIRKRLAEYFTKTDVTVELARMGVRPGRAVTVIGQVPDTGSFHYFEGMRIMDALAKGGGVTRYADAARISISRGEDQIIHVNAKDMINGMDMSNNVLMMPGDYVIVPTMRPQGKIKVVVLGSVTKPGSYLLEEGAQMLDALAEAEGSKGRSGLGKSYVIRSVNGRPIIIHSDLKALIQRAELKENVELMDGDIVFIPESSGFNVMRSVEDILSLNMLRNIVNDEF